MTLKADLIVAALETALKADPPVAGTIFVSGKRMRPIVAQECPAVLLRPLRAQGGEDLDAIGHATRYLTVVVSCHDRGDTAGTDAGAIAEAVLGRLDADPTLGGLAGEITVPTAEWEFATADEALAILHLGVRIRYRTGELEL